MFRRQDAANVAARTTDLAGGVVETVVDTASDIGAEIADLTAELTGRSKRRARKRWGLMVAALAAIVAAVLVWRSRSADDEETHELRTADVLPDHGVGSHAPIDVADQSSNNGNPLPSMAERN